MILKMNSNSKIASKNIYLGGMSEPNKINYLDGVYLGKSKIFRIPLVFDSNKLINKNIAILGMSGAGKSYFLKSFIIRNHLQRYSQVLIIDWNNEYKAVVEFLGGITLKLGTGFKINLFDLYDLGNVKNIRDLSEIISYNLNFDKEESYLLYNKMLSLNADKLFKKMNINLLIRKYREEKNSISDKLANKLLQLNGSPMFSDKTDFPMEKILEGVVSIDFSGLKDDSQRSEISKSIFRIIIELMHNIKISDTTISSEKLVVLDEAWRLIKNSEDVGVLFREGRKYGFCIAVATQLVNDINNEIISNVATIFLFRLQNESDYKSLQDSGIIDKSEINKIMHLPIGSCMVTMALKENNNKTNRFFIESIDGIAINSYYIKSGKMRTLVSNKKLIESTKKLQVTIEVKDRILDFVYQNNSEVEGTTLVNYMINLGIERPEIIYYLRLLGLKDVNIVKIYHNVAISVLNR